METNSFTQVLKPISTTYGTGDVHFDALICVGAIAVLFMALAFLLMRRGGTAVYDGVGSSDEIRRKIDVLAKDLQITVEHMRGETGYLRQELEEIRRTIAAVKEAVISNREPGQKIIDVAMGKEKTSDDEFLFDYEL